MFFIPVENVKAQKSRSKVPDNVSRSQRRPIDDSVHISPDSERNASPTIKPPNTTINYTHTRKIFTVGVTILYTIQVLNYAL